MKKTIIIIAASILALVVTFFAVRGIVLKNQGNQKVETTLAAEESVTEASVDAGSEEDDDSVGIGEELIIELNDHQAIGGF